MFITLGIPDNFDIVSCAFRNCLSEGRPFRCQTMIRAVNCYQSFEYHPEKPHFIFISTNKKKGRRQKVLGNLKRRKFYTVKEQRMSKSKFDTQKLFVFVDILLIVNIKWNVVKKPIEFLWLECILYRWCLLFYYYIRLGSGLKRTL